MDDDVASVSRAYRSPLRSGWVAWDMYGRLIEEADVILTTVGGNGFGCVVLRRSVLPT
jgi:hypothetical protein